MEKVRTMNNKIFIQQTLHGYLNGHHMLAASKELSDNSQRIMSIISDLSGPEICKGFYEYITGYPLLEDNYYALSKTWYASEMKRPGCVWTHTLLVRMEDLDKIKDCNDLVKLFLRPSAPAEKALYSKVIEYYPKLENYDRNAMNNISISRIKELIWMVYNDENPAIMPSVSSETYLNETLYLWQNQSSEIRKKFTFCTGSLAGRKLNKENFDLQVIPNNLAKSIVRSIGKARVFDNMNKQVDSSKWVNIILENIYEVSNSNFDEFMKLYSTGFSEKKYVSKLAQLYYETDSKNGMAEIEKYLILVNAIFNQIDSLKIKNITINRLLYNTPNKWFKYEDVFKIFEELSTTDQLNYINLNDLELKSKVSNMWGDSKYKAKETFKNLITKDINGFGEELIKAFATIVKPNELPELTDMDLGACNLLVNLNAEYAMCKEIWNQSKDFQAEILNCIDEENLNQSVVVSILENIFVNSNECLFDQVYRKFGKKAIRIFLNWCLKTNCNDCKKIDSWMNLCKNEPQECIEWILNNDLTNHKHLLISILSILDPYKEEVFEISSSIWSMLFNKVNIENVNEYSQIKLAELFLPIILLKNDKLPEDLVRFSFLIIHEQLAKQQFTYDKWERLENLLPEVAWYNSWDKCKRLRKALKKKGYSIKEMLN